jgi:hypothetical protein
MHIDSSQMQNIFTYLFDLIKMFSFQKNKMREILHPDVSRRAGKLLGLAL